MPRRIRHGKRRRVAVDWRITWLTTGVEPPAGTPGLNVFAFVDPLDTAREAWSELRDTVMAAHIKARNCTRPWAWWLLEAPEPRQRIDGISAPVQGLGGELRFGIPANWAIDPKSSWAKVRGVRLFDVADPPRYESQAAYLQRLGLLQKNERSTKRDLKPETLTAPHAATDTRKGN